MMYDLDTNIVPNDWTSENAIKWQIWTALLTYLLLRLNAWLRLIPTQEHIPSIPSF